MAITEMFAEWRVFFKNKMQTGKNFYNGTEATMWANYLTAKQITKREFEKAKTASLDLDFPPNNPKEFLDLGRENKFLDVYTAYQHACHQRYTTVEIYETAKRVGFYELRNHAESKTYPVWQKNYEQVCQEVRQGKSFTLPKSQRLQEPKHTPVSRSEMQAYIQNLKKSIGAVA